MSESADEKFGRWHREAVAAGKYVAPRGAGNPIGASSILASVQRIGNAIAGTAVESNAETKAAGREWWAAVRAGDDYQMLMLEGKVIAAWKKPL